MKLVDQMYVQSPMIQSDFFDHFFDLSVSKTLCVSSGSPDVTYLLPGRWSTLAALIGGGTTAGDTGSSVALTATGDSVVTLTTGGTDNNEVGIWSNHTWDMLASRPFTAEIRFKATDLTSNTNNYFIGFSSAFAANLITDNGAALATTFSGLGLYKFDGDTQWRIVASVGTTRYLNKQINVASPPTSGATYTSLKIKSIPISATEAECTFEIDTAGGDNYSQVYEYQDASRKLLKAIVTMTSYSTASVGAYLKTGAGTTTTLDVDVVRVGHRV